MKFIHFLNAIALLAFGFALGTYYYHSKPIEPIREIASEKTEKTEKKLDKNNERLSTAFRECVQESIKDGKLNWNKVDVDGHNWPILSLDCLGDKAKALYEASEPYADEQYVRYSDGRRGIGRFFGRLYPPSQCARVTRNAKGGEMNLYSCSVRLDLAHEMITDLKP